MLFVDKTTIDLLVPLLLIFAIVKLQTKFCYPQKLLLGIRFFVSNTLLSSKHIRPPSNINQDQQQQQNGGSIIDKKLSDYNVSMVELDGSTRKGSIFTGVLLYDTYDNLVCLGLCSFVVQIFSSIFHCIYPEAVYSIWGSILVIFSVIMPFRTLIGMVFMIGFAAMETKIALLTGILSFFLMTIISFMIPTSHLDILHKDMLQNTAIHFNELLLQISSAAYQPPTYVMIILIKLFICFFSSLMAFSMVIPAIYYSQAFYSVIFDTKYTKYNRFLYKKQILLLLDYFFPLLIISVIVIPYYLSVHYNMEISPESDGYCLALQLIVILAMAATRLFCMKIYIQNFLDMDVKSISIQIAINDDTEVKGIQDKISARFNYIPVLATQYVCIPFFILGLAILIQKTAPIGTGLCMNCRQILGFDTMKINLSNIAMLNHNSTLILSRISNSKSPTIMKGIHLLMMGAGEGGISPSRDIRDFLVTAVSLIHILPVGVFLVLGRLIIVLHSIFWFIISTIGIIYLYFNPITLLNKNTLVKKNEKDD